MSGSTNKAEATLLRRVALFFYGCGLPAALALVGFLSVFFTLDAGSDLAWSLDGPGVTFDEGFNAEAGSYLIDAFQDAGPAVLHPETLRDISNADGYLADHPPLGRWVLGASQTVARWLWQDGTDRKYVITYARIGSAVMFGLLIGLVTAFGLRHIGTWGGVTAGLAVLLMPRVFAHAHLAALETAMNLTYTGFVLGTAGRWNAKRRLRLRDGIFPGILLGFALLTKMQAVFLPVVFVIWAGWNWRWRAILPIGVVALTSAAVLLLGWPWLWGWKDETVLDRVMEYFLSASERSILYCYYLGQRYADREVPWHYPWVMFIATTPICWLLLGLWGMRLPARQEENAQATWNRRLWGLIVAAMVAPLIVFSLPGVTVYDGTRLFLVSWPLFAVLIGAGFQRRVDRFPPARRSMWAGAALVVAAALPLCQIISLHPLQLSYYSEIVGGLRGAARLGFEPTYWGDSVTPQFLRNVMQQLPQDSAVGMAPVLHPRELKFLREGSELRHRPDITLEAYDDRNPQHARYVIVIRRHADPWGSLSPPPAGTQVLARVTRGGVALAEFLKLPD